MGEGVTGGYIHCSCYHGHLSSLKPLSHYKYAEGVGINKTVTIVSEYNCNQLWSLRDTPGWPS